MCDVPYNYYYMGKENKLISFLSSSTYKQCGKETRGFFITDTNKKVTNIHVFNQQNKCK